MHASWCFKDQREKLATKLNNLRLAKITFHILRHWKATMEYYKTKDIIHVQQLLGHISIQSTTIHITIEKAVLKETEDQWISNVAHNIQEAQKLVDVGFEYVCDFGAKGETFQKTQVSFIHLSRSFIFPKVNKGNQDNKYANLK